MRSTQSVHSPADDIVISRFSYFLHALSTLLFQLSSGKTGSGEVPRIGTAAELAKAGAVAITAVATAKHVATPPPAPVKATTQQAPSSQTKTIAKPGVTIAPSAQPNPAAGTGLPLPPGHFTATP